MIRFIVATGDHQSAIASFYESLSDESMSMRFSARRSRSALWDVAHLDAQRGDVSVLAIDVDRVIGEARYVPTQPSQAEFGVALLDDYQGRGIGPKLLRELRREAVTRGVSALRAVVRADNRPMLSMVQSLECAMVQPPTFGTVEFDMSADHLMPGWAAGSRGVRVLVEARGLYEHAATAQLRQAGFSIRQCPGPVARKGRTCPLLTQGRCRLAEQADIIASLLPTEDADGRAVQRAHDASHPDRVVANTVADWNAAVPGLLEEARGWLARRDVRG